MNDQTAQRSFSWSKPHLYRDDGWWFCRIGGHVMGASLRDPREAYVTAVRTWFRVRKVA